MNHSGFWAILKRKDGFCKNLFIEKWVPYYYIAEYTSPEDNMYKQDFDDIRGAAATTRKKCFRFSEWLGTVAVYEELY